MKPILKVDKNIFCVSRGGGWRDSMQFARVAYRGWWAPGDRYCDLGFRLFEGMR